MDAYQSVRYKLDLRCNHDDDRVVVTLELYTKHNVFIFSIYNQHVNKITIEIWKLAYLYEHVDWMVLENIVGEIGKSSKIDQFCYGVSNWEYLRIYNAGTGENVAKMHPTMMKIVWKIDSREKKCWEIMFNRW